MTPRAGSALGAGEPVALSWTTPDLTADPDLVEAATIPVENIDGAVLLVVGADDIGGYGVAFHDVAARRLEAHKHPHTWRHIVHPGPGHNIIAPPDGKGDPANDRPRAERDHVPERRNPEIDLRARADTWQEPWTSSSRSCKRQRISDASVEAVDRWNGNGNVMPKASSAVGNSIELHGLAERWEGRGVP